MPAAYPPLLKIAPSLRGGESGRAGRGEYCPIRLDVAFIPSEIWPKWLKSTEIVDGAPTGQLGQYLCADVSLRASPIWRLSWNSKMRGVGGAFVRMGPLL